MRKNTIYILYLFVLLYSNNNSLLDRKRITRAENKQTNNTRSTKNQLIVIESKVQNIQTLNVIYIIGRFDFSS